VRRLLYVSVEKRDLKRVMKICCFCIAGAQTTYPCCERGSGYRRWGAALGPGKTRTGDRGVSGMLQTLGQRCGLRVLLLCDVTRRWAL